MSLHVLVGQEDAYDTFLDAASTKSCSAPL